MPDVLAIDFQNRQASQPQLESLRQSLSEGGVIAFPTDTLYGLGADPFNFRAVEKLFELKQRRATEPILVLIHSEEQLPLFTANVNAVAKKLMDRFWPGPLTILFDALEILPRALTAGTDKIGIRLPGSDYTRQFLQEIGHPLTATSANISGERNPVSLSDIPQALASGLSFMVNNGPAKETAASTVVDPGTSPPRIVREGVIATNTIHALFQ